jgi:hypothetical protein
MSTLNINQFAQVPVRGQQDLKIALSGVVSGIVSANQATPILAGDPVKLDSAIVIAGTPQFVEAGTGDVAHGYMIFDPKTASAPTPNAIQVALRFVGPVIWLLAAGTIPPGSFVEQTAGPNDVQVLAAGKLRGLALDYATVGQLTRILLVPAFA